MAPGPPKAVGKGLFSNGFIAMLLTERFVGGPEHELAGDRAGPAGGGDLAGDAWPGRARRPRRCWTRWRTRSRSGPGTPGTSTPTRRRGGCSPPATASGPAKWWLWVFIGPDTVCFVMDPSRSGAVLARHAGIDEKTGQLTGGRGRRAAPGWSSPATSTPFTSPRGRRPTAWSISTAGLISARHFVRAGDASPVQLKYWTEAWLDLIRDLYARS